MTAGDRLIWYCWDCFRWVKGFRCPCEGGKVPSGGREDMGSYVDPPIWEGKISATQIALAKESRKGDRPK